MMRFVRAETTGGGGPRTGKALEYLIAASCILMSEGKLNVSTPLVDDEGVDLVFNRFDRPSTLAVQIKGRSLSAQVVKDAQAKGDQIIRDAEGYALEQLKQLEAHLGRTLATVRRGVEALQANQPTAEEGPDQATGS